MNKIELLAPAGNLEKAKIAILYGADAVYIGGKSFSLRSRASNFSLDEIKELVQFANLHQAHVHVTVNMLPHESDFDGLKEYLYALNDAGVHAIIVASPSIMMFAKSLKCQFEVHVSTQHSTTNSKAIQFWKRREWIELYSLVNVNCMKLKIWPKRIFYQLKCLSMAECVYLILVVVS